MVWVRAVRPTAYDVQAVLLWHCFFVLEAEWYWVVSFFLLDAAGRLGRRWGMKNSVTTPRVWPRPGQTVMFMGKEVKPGDSFLLWRGTLAEWELHELIRKGELLVSEP